MRISVACLVLNLIASLWLIGPLRQGGLGLANTLSSAVNVWLLLRALRKKLKRLELEALRPTLLALAAATALAGAAAFAVAHQWGKYELTLDHVGLGVKLGAVILPMAAAAAVYGGVALGCRVPQAREIGELVRRRWRRP
jgi:putative peptidoglycan lipid II flippase